MFYTQLSLQLAWATTTVALPNLPAQRDTETATPDTTAKKGLSVNRTVVMQP